MAFICNILYDEMIYYIRKALTPAYEFFQKLHIHITMGTGGPFPGGKSAAGA
jgi:hypothetical protein